MKREGRQHGLVRTYPLCASEFDRRPQPRYNRTNSPPTAGLFIKVSTKPTNHSKFTGKCGKPRCSGCHLHPVCKSKVKSKGTQKIRSITNGVSSNNYGLSSTVILDHLANEYYDDDNDHIHPEDDINVTDEQDDQEDWCLV
ncbi:uncharacterized protein LOC124927373 [Impatiens glandulifera]|uniref:uncharacterized protein LOC124927373 n=1 Tax=Impatiens glandulifera TaxID=253017 RepID=UPI001FB17591|nr:uncharacterized protein LOC124927373 [Impatiens glandulifera]